MACVSTSIPQAAVPRAGMPRVSVGSSSTTAGATDGLLKVNLRCTFGLVSVSVMRPPPLVSDAVPEVVGNAIVGNPGFDACARGASVPKSMRSFASRFGANARCRLSTPFGAANAMYLPQSITEPPPMNTTTVPSTPNLFSAATPAATFTSVGLGDT